MTYVIQLNLKIVETFTQFKYFFLKKNIYIYIYFFFPRKAMGTTLSGLTITSILLGCYFLLLLALGTF